MFPLVFIPIIAASLLKFATVEVSIIENKKATAIFKQPFYNLDWKVSYPTLGITLEKGRRLGNDYPTCLQYNNFVKRLQKEYGMDTSRFPSCTGLMLEKDGNYTSK